MSLLRRPNVQYRCRSATRQCSRVANRSPIKHVTRPRSLLGISPLQTPQDLEALVEGALLELSSTASLSASQVDQQQQQQGPTAAAGLAFAHQHVQALQNALEFIEACHPNSSWQAAAHAALQQLSSTLVYSATSARAVAAAAAATNQQQQREQSLYADTVGEVQQLIQHAAQLDIWVAELSDFQSVTAAAAAGISLDPACAPVLLLDAAAAQQHPIWASDYAAYVAASHTTTEPAAAGPQRPPTTAAAAAAAAQSACVVPDALPFLLPTQSELVVGGGASLDIGHHYSTAAAAAGTGGVSCGTLRTSTNSSSSNDTTSQGPMQWPLTAAATKLLLSSPLGVLPDAVLHQVYRLGLVGRCGALADAVDLARLVGTELHAAQEEQQQLGQQLTQQLQQLHTAVQAGIAVDPVLLAAAASAAATTASNHPPAAAAVAAGDQACVVKDAVIHPAVAVQFLQELAAFGKTAAADELQSWLDLCRQDPVVRSYLEASGGLAQLPTDASCLQHHQIDALRETVAVAQANMGFAGAKSVKSQANVTEQRGSQDWLQDYTDMNTLLPSICTMLSDCLQLDLHCTAGGPGATWCQEAYLITVSDQQQQSARRGKPPFSSSSSSSSRDSGCECNSRDQQQVRGYIWLLFDDSYYGMPATHMVSPGAPAAHFDTHNVPVGHAGSDQQQQQQATSSLLAALHATTVAVVLPSSFCSANRRFSSNSGSGRSSKDDTTTASSSSSSRNGSSAFSVLQSVLHELGHALHFLLSASASAAPAAAGGHLSSLVLMETASHLVERMARNATCLQAMLKPRVDQQPPHPAFIQQLLAYNSISTRGVYQWHQHVLAALTDSLLEAQLAAVESGSAAGAVPDTASTSSSCWEVLQQVTRMYDPLALHQDQHSSSRLQSHINSVRNNGCEVVSSAMLEYLPALAVLQPGDMYCYICADLVAAALWGRYLQEDPLDPAAWQILRQGLFESDARDGTLAVVARLLGRGSMQERSVQLAQKQQAGGAVRVCGWVPNLEHPCFQDIDLWG